MSPANIFSAERSLTACVSVAQWRPPRPRFLEGREHSERILLLAEMLGQRAEDAAGKKGSAGVCLTLQNLYPLSASPQPFHRSQAQPSLSHKQAHQSFIQKSHGSSYSSIKLSETAGTNPAFVERGDVTRHKSSHSKASSSPQKHGTACLPAEPGALCNLKWVGWLGSVRAGMHTCVHFMHRHHPGV